MKHLSSRLRRQKKHFRIRKQIAGSSETPRLSVFRSAAHIYAQIIDDKKASTLVFESDLKLGSGKTKSAKALEVGKKIAEKALKKGIKTVVFDRGGFLYHGRIQKVAEGAREGGLKF